MKKIYAIGVGGSGAKCIESVVFLHAVGLFGQDCELHILLVDTDETNGNLVRTQENINKTLTCHQQFQKGHSDFMSENLQNYGVWNPLGVTPDSSFERILQLRVNDPLKGLFEVLYSPDERAMNFKVGFRGRPPVGSAILGTLGIDNARNAGVNRIGATETRDALERIILSIQNNEGYDGVKIHLFGSVFGGTGASGIPNLARLISNRLGGPIRANVQINASLLLPYFEFDKPPEEEKVFAEKRFFNLNSQAALYYLDEHAPGALDNIYLLGNNYPKNYRSKTGGEEQRNDAHFVELYAALAMMVPTKPNPQTTVAYICRQDSKAVTWGDLPNGQEVKEKLGTAVRFAYAWRHNFSQELDASMAIGSKKFAVGAPWFPIFFSLNDQGGNGGKSQRQGGKTGNRTLPVKTQTEAIRALNEWTEAFLIWAKQVSGSHQRANQLFKLGLSNSKPYRQELIQLLVDGQINPQDKNKDTIDNFKNQLANLDIPEHYGVFGLVHHLYELI